MKRYEPHPYALMLPPLTEPEYEALKADIDQHGILYPAILDEDELVLDGVHRERIAAELGVELPVSQMGHLSDERKLHLAVGLNMRRRQMDAERRRELVHTLSTEQGLSVRAIAAVTGWSKSTVARDLQPEPTGDPLDAYERAIESARALLEEEDPAIQKVGEALIAVIERRRDEGPAQGDDKLVRWAREQGDEHVDEIGEHDCGWYGLADLFAVPDGTPA